MYRVEISARIIRWPPVCACCCRPADSSIEISSTRVTGKRIIRSQTKSWEIPYCRRCLAHIKASRTLHGFSMFVMHMSVVIGLIGAFATFLVFLPLLLVSKGLAIGLGLVVAAGSVALIAATYKGCREKYQRQKNEKRRKRRELVDRLESLMCDHCAEEVKIAARYGGWYGTIHTFYFSSDEFAARVEEANRGKCLRRGSTHRGRH
jgi:hypothetical protein